MNSSSNESHESLKELSQNKGEHEKAIKYSKKILKRKKTNFGKVHAKVADEYKIIGNLYSDAQKYDYAVQYFLKALQIKEIVSEKNDTELGEWYHGLSYVYEKLQDSAKALKYAQKAHILCACTWFLV